MNEYGRPKVTYYWVPQGILAKKAIFQAKTLFQPIFFRIIEYEKPQGTIYTGPQVFVTVFVEVIRSFLQDLRYEVDENNFTKKGYFAFETQFWPILSRINEYGRP